LFEILTAAWIIPDMPAETAVKSEDTKPPYQPSPQLVTYYTHMSKIIMGNSEELFQVQVNN
jgi:hypothetical protein